VSRENDDLFITSRLKGGGASKWVVIVSNKHNVVTRDLSRLPGMAIMNTKARVLRQRNKILSSKELERAVFL
jgi:hypothetical protein